MNIFLDDSRCRDQLKPFTDTRHVADIRIGMLTIKEKWEKLTGLTVLTNEVPTGSGTTSIPANIIPTLENAKLLLQSAQLNMAETNSDNIRVLEYPWQIFQYNDWAIRKDFELLTRNNKSQPLPVGNQVVNGENVFIEEGATIQFSILNASAGPIYIAKSATIMEGCLIRGPFALGENSMLKMGSRIYGATTIGPGCVAGGEIKNSVFFEYSNKAHDGYLGDSVIGAWCNLGAGTSNSNVKNTGSDVAYYSDQTTVAGIAGNKAGLLMGDYSRSAINTSFNTGTVAGVCCNIFGNPFPDKYIPNFTWGQTRYEFDKALKDIDNWKQMKKQHITEEEIQVLKKLYQQENKSNHA